MITLFRMKSPVLVMAYRRYELLCELLSLLPQDRAIYIHLDGPKPNHQSDVAKCEKVIRDFILENPRAKIYFKKQKCNLGNRESFLASMEWVFEFEETLILLEEDIRFNSSFFAFMDWGLEKFKDSPRIFQINGFSVLDIFPGRQRLYESYTCRPWGFGTWKNSFLIHINTRIDSGELWSLPVFHNCKLSETFKLKWSDRFGRLEQGTDTYDLGWNYSAWKNNSYAITPRFSFTTNIGFDDRALHTRVKPFFIRSPKALKHLQLNFLNKPVVMFPSSYDAYSDLIEWKTPGINKGGARFLNSLYNFLIFLRRQLRS